MKPQAALAIYRECLFVLSDIIEARIINSANGDTESRWVRAVNLPTLAQELSRKNAAGWNIYAGANPRRAFNERGDVAVEFAPSMFADFDGIGVDEALMRIESVGLPRPTLIVTTGHGVHCYWRFNMAMEDMDRWTELQKDLIAAVGSDGVIHNPERIMRLPGFQNWKKNDGAFASINEAEPSRRYIYDHLRAIVPERPRLKTACGTQRPASGSRHGDESDGERWLRKALERVQPGIEEYGRNATGFWLAQQLRDSGMSRGEAEQWAREYAARVPSHDHPYHERDAIKSIWSAFQKPRRERARRMVIA